MAEGTDYEAISCNGCDVSRQTHSMEGCAFA